MCVDYLGLNFVTKFYCFLLFRLDDALDKFDKVTVVSSINLAMAFNQISIKYFNLQRLR